MLKLNPEERLFIDGALVAAENGQTYNVINLAREEVAGVVAAASLADADRALAAARRCFDQSDWPTNKTRRLKALTQSDSRRRRNREAILSEKDGFSESGNGRTGNAGAQ